MTIFIDTPSIPANATFAGGIGSLADIAAAARDSLLYVENAYASSDALRRVLDDRRRAIHDATGAQLPDPLAAAQEEFRQKAAERSIAPFSDRWTHDDRPETLEEIYNRHIDAFRGELATLSEKFPDARDAIGADRNPWDDAAELARKADERLGTLMASRSGLGKYGALLAGGMVGSLADPLTVMSLAAGGGPGATRTVAGRILSVAGKEAIINAATEAAIQPGVQEWRDRIGLDAGMDEAIRNVLFAGVMGGAFGGAFGAAGEALSRHLRPADGERSVAALAGDTRLPETARQMLSGDGLRAADTLAELRPAMRAEQRGALDAAESIRQADEIRPAAANPERYDATLTEADRVVRLPDYAEAWPGFQPDPVQIERVVRAIAGETQSGPVRAETPLIDFLIARGGVADFKGELRAIGAGEISERFRGRLVREDGDSLDYAREAAAEAGFFDHLYGDAETAANRSTVADLLDVLEEEIRVRTGGAAASAEEAALGTLEGIVADIARMAGPSVDDAVLTRAARMAAEDGVEPFDALERVLIAEDLPAHARPDRTGEPMPGWSDAELLAASERRGAWPEPDGIDKPGRLSPDDTDFEGELARRAASSGPFGPVATAESFGGDWAAIVRHLSRQADGEVTGALSHPETGAIDVPWGFYDPDTGQGAGLAKIVAKHGDVVEALPDIVAGMTVTTRSPNRIRLASEAHRAVIRLDYDGQDKTWLMTAFEIRRRAGETTDRPGSRQADGHSSSASPADTNIGRAAADDNLDTGLDAGADALLARAADDLDGLPDDFMVPTDDGTVSVAALRDEAARRENTIRLVEACKA